MVPDVIVMLTLNNLHIYLEIFKFLFNLVHFVSILTSLIVQLLGEAHQWYYGRGIVICNQYY